VADILYTALIYMIEAWVIGHILPITLAILCLSAFVGWSFSIRRNK